MRLYSVVLVCVSAATIVTTASFTTVQENLVLSSSPPLADTANVRPIDCYERIRRRVIMKRGNTDLLKVKSWLTTYITRNKLTSEDKQLQDWLKASQTPDDVLNLLRVDDEFETILKSPHFNKLSNYITKYNDHFAIKNPEKEVTMLGLFVKTYGDEAMVKTLEVAKQDSSMAELAKRIQGDLFAGWAGNGLSTEVVYKLLKVDDEGVKDLFMTPAFNAWMNFDDMVNHYNPAREENMLKTLLTTFDEIPLAKAIELARTDSVDDIIPRLQQPLFEKWVREEIKPEILGKRLKLDRFTWEIDPTNDILREYGRFYARKVLFRPKKFQNPTSAG